MNYRVGEVIAIQGMKIILKIDDISNKEVVFFNGKKYKGVSIRSFLLVRRGFRDLVCIVEGEYLDENRSEQMDNKVVYVRKVEARPIGYFEGKKFNEGIKFLPMIKDEVTLLSDEQVSQIFSKHIDENFIIGSLLKEEIPISLPWGKIFNTHVGVFGNTGSGKSNTLTKLFTVLFDQKKECIKGKSKFIFIDFNGEYTGEQLLDQANKKVITLDTSRDNGDKIKLSDSEFWNLETLSILFQATQNTQRPFLNRVINGKKRYSESKFLTNYFKIIFKKVFTTPNIAGETLEIFKLLAKKIGEWVLSEKLDTVLYHTGQSRFKTDSGTFFDSENNFNSYFQCILDEINLNNLDMFTELIVRVNLQLCSDLTKNYVQFDHIQPLLKRIESSSISLNKIIDIAETNQVKDKLLTVVSLRKCNNDAKKIIPLLIAKNFYHEHRDSVTSTPPNQTLHIVIDEAHNILSDTSSREHESWRDYRLELFEEIIKEGRKFGVFLTISSQRPADISPTIISQLHNFFIHRLVNDRDLFLLDNTVSTMDRVSRGLIPNLGKGCCVVTGTAFEIPMVLQIDKLDTTKQPDSQDVDLDELWKA